jgi:hypothetical protein
MILKTNIYLSTINVFILMMPYLSCDCGPFGYTPYHKLYNYRNVSSESSEITYYCFRNDFSEFYKAYRKCIKGKWTGRVPKCGKYKTIKFLKKLIKISFHLTMKALDVSPGFVIKTMEINYLDRNSSREIYINKYINKTLIETNCFHFNQTKNLKIKLNYSPHKRISAIDFNFKDLLDQNYRRINQMFFNLFINANRICNR